MSGHPSTPEPIELRGADGLVVRGDRWVPSGPAGHEVLMLHGGGQTRHSWGATGARLAERGFAVTTLDARGHGDSDWSAHGEYDFETMAGDVEAVLGQLSAPVLVVGASMGGLTGLDAAVRVGPQVADALVLVDVVPRVELAGAERIVTFMASGLDGFATLDDAHHAIADYLPHRRREPNYEGLKRNLRLRDGRWYWHWDPRFIERPLQAVANDSDRLEQIVGDLQIPVLLLHGMLSDVVTDEAARRFAALVPQLQVVHLERAAHTAAGDDNDAFTDAVLDFATGLRH